MMGNTVPAFLLLPALQISSRVALDEGAAPQHDGLLGLHIRLAVATHKVGGGQSGPVSTGETHSGLGLGDTERGERTGDNLHVLQLS